MKSLEKMKIPLNSSKKEKKEQILLVVRVFICIFSVGLTLFAYIEKQNELTELRLAIPNIIKEVKNLQEENIRLTFEVEYFESPIHLMELMRKPEFSHLKYPFLQDQIFLFPGQPLTKSKNDVF